MLALTSAAGVSAQEATLQQQLDAQNALIQKQEQALEQQRKLLETQSQQMQEMTDRLRRAEDGSTSVAVEPAASGAEQEAPAGDEGIGSWQCGRGFVVGETPYGSVYRQYEPLWRLRAPRTQDLVLKRSYERLFDAARLRVRAWERANPR